MIAIACTPGFFLTAHGQTYNNLNVDQAYGNSPYTITTTGNFNNIDVGVVTQGTLVQKDGSQVVSQGQIIIGDLAGSSGEYDLGDNTNPNGVDETLVTTSMIVGNAGQGVFNEDATGRLTINGTLSLQANAASSGGTFYLGGAMTVTQIGQNSGTAAGTFYFMGGAVFPNASNATFMQGLKAAYIYEGASFNTAGYSITIAQPLLNYGTPTDGGLSKEGAGTLTLTGTNTYTGSTVIYGGSLNAGSAAALGNGGTISFGGGTLQYSAASAGTDYSSRFSTAASQPINLDTNGNNVTLGSGIVGSGTNLTKLGAGTLTLNASNTYTGTTTISEGTVQVGSGATAGSLGTGSVTNNGLLNFKRSDGVTVASGIGGTGGLTQSGTGTLILSGANTYSGPTKVNAGTLLLNGANTGRSGISVDGGSPAAILGGTGSTNGAVIAHLGVVNPGPNGGAAGSAAVVGNLQVGSLTLDNASTLSLDVNTASLYDVLTSAGNVVLGGSALNINVSPSASFTRGQTLDLIHLTSGGLSGTFAGVVNNGTYSFGGDLFQAEYLSQDFELVAVPEPASWLGGALLLGLSGVGAWQRRVRRA